MEVKKKKTSNNNNKGKAWGVNTQDNQAGMRAVEATTEVERHRGRKCKE